MTPHDDLIAAARAGDGAAFQTLFEGLRGKLERHVQRLLGSGRDEAQDIVQITAQRGWQSIQSVRDGPFHITSWLYTIAGNLARDELRRRKARRMHSIDQRSGGQCGKWCDEMASHDTPPAPHGALHVLATDESPDPAAIYEAHESLLELRATLASVMHALPERGAEALIRRASGQSYAEIGEGMGLQWSQVKSLLERSRHQARARMRGGKDVARIREPRE